MLTTQRIQQHLLEHSSNIRINQKINHSIFIIKITNKKSLFLVAPMYWLDIKDQFSYDLSLYMILIFFYYKGIEHVKVQNLKIYSFKFLQLLCIEIKRLNCITEITLNVLVIKYIIFTIIPTIFVTAGRIRSITMFRIRTQLSIILFGSLHIILWETSRNS